MARKTKEEKPRTKADWKARRDGLRALKEEWDLYPNAVKKFKRYYNGLLRRIDEAAEAAR
jgi:hypothetical protein